MDSPANDSPKYLTIFEAPEGLNEAKIAGLVLGNLRGPEEYQALVDKVRDVKAFQKRVVEFFEPMKTAAHKAHAAICAREKEALTGPARDERIGKMAIDGYLDAAEKRKAAALQAAQEAERRRVEDERLAEAAALEREGREFGDESCIAEAHALIEAPIDVATVSVHIEPTPSHGVSRSTKARVATVVDLKALALAVAEGRAPLSYLLPNQKLLDTQATALGRDFNVPGCVSAPKPATVSIR